MKKFTNVWKLEKWKLNENCKLSIENFIPKIMLLSLLIFGMFDHFLWTIEPGRLMFWIVLGIVMGACGSSQEDKDTSS